MSFIDRRLVFASLLAAVGASWALASVTAATRENQTSLFANGIPQASSSIDSVVDEGGGRFTVGGTALDLNGNPACALVLASGRCMFTCGGGSPRCEGGAANLPFGRFLLTDLPTEPDGTIIVQTFIQGHVSGTQVLGE